MRRKIIAVVLSLMIATAFMPVFSYAAGNDISSGYTLLFKDDVDSFSYDGKEHKPDGFIVVDADAAWDGNDFAKSYEEYVSMYGEGDDGTFTLESKYYTVAFPSDCTSVGEKKITITGRNGHTGSFTKSYYITPKELKFTVTKNSDKSVTLTANEDVDLSSAKVTFWIEDLELVSGTDFAASGKDITIFGDFLENLVANDLKHQVNIYCGNYYGEATVESYNISGLAGLGNIKKVYSGKQKSLTSSDLGINDAKMGKQYKIVYSKKTRKAIGKYKYTLEAIGDYVGEIKGSFQIIPKAPAKVTSAKRTKTKATVKWKKVDNCSGYQVQLIKLSDEDSDMISYDVYKKVFVKGKSNLTKTFKNVKKSKYSKVRVRAYKTVNGTKYYSSWKYKRF